MSISPGKHCYLFYSGAEMDDATGAGRKFDRAEFLTELEELLLRYRPGILLAVHPVAYHAKGLEESLFGLRDVTDVGPFDEQAGTLP